MTDYSNVHVESHLPKPWEQETTFNDTLYDWMGRAPWLAISAAAHLLAYFIMSAIPWDAFGGQDSKIINATAQAAPEEIIEEPEEEIEEAFRFLYGRAKLACEPAGAVAVAAILAGKAGEGPMAAVVSGGNVAAETASAILASR